MKIKTKYEHEGEWEHYSIEVDGKERVSIGTPEPEDANLSRDFCDIYNIGNLLKLAYEAGQRGEDFEIINGFQADF